MISGPSVRWGTVRADRSTFPTFPGKACRMDALINFLNARLAEDEQVAQSCPYPSWVVSGPPVGHYAYSDTSDLLCAQIRADTWRNIAEPTMWAGQSLRHAARHDPARVLREVEAKRKLVGLAKHELGWTDEYDKGVTDHEIRMMRVAGEEILRFLALPYSDHPDYQQEWAA